MVSNPLDLIYDRLARTKDSLLVEKWQIWLIERDTELGFQVHHTPHHSGNVLTHFLLSLSRINRSPRLYHRLIIRLYYSGSGMSTPMRGNDFWSSLSFNGKNG